jgi:hypothetical protein
VDDEIAGSGGAKSDEQTLFGYLSRIYFTEQRFDKIKGKELRAFLDFDRHNDEPSSYVNPRLPPADSLA